MGYEEFKCEYCKKFISYEDMRSGQAQHFFTPDSDLSIESSYWICSSCKAQNSTHTGA